MIIIFHLQNASTLFLSSSSESLVFLVLIMFLLKRDLVFLINLINMFFLHTNYAESVKDFEFTGQIMVKLFFRYFLASQCCYSDGNILTRKY